MIREFGLIDVMYLVAAARWTLAHADEASVRRIAAALGIQYRRLPNGEFSHSTIISVLDPAGKILVQSAELGSADSEVLRALNSP